jgi:hypothetical protein
VVKRVRDDLLGHVVGEVVVEPPANVPVDGFELDENQRQAVDEADKVRPAVVMRHPQSLQLQLAHGDKAIVGRVAKVNDAGMAVTGLAVWLPPGDRHAIADVAIEFAIVLDQGTGVVDLDELLEGLLAGRFRECGIEPGDRGA